MNDLTGLKTRVFKNSGSAEIKYSQFRNTHFFSNARARAQIVKKVRTIAALR